MEGQCSRENPARYPWVEGLRSLLHRSVCGLGVPTCCAVECGYLQQLGRLRRRRGLWLANVSPQLVFSGAFTYTYQAFIQAKASVISSSANLRLNCWKGGRNDRKDQINDQQWSNDSNSSLLVRCLTMLFHITIFIWFLHIGVVEFQ
jgi:hypothetical protein